MPDVIDRFEKEKQASDAVWATWLALSQSEDDPTRLSSQRITEAARKTLVEPMHAQWDSGYHALADQFRIAKNNRRAAIFFLLFFDDWTATLGSRWNTRVRQYQYDQAEDDSRRPPWRYVRGEGVESELDDGVWQPRPRREDPGDRRRVLGAKPLITPADANRIGVQVITNTNTAGEMFGRREVERAGSGRLEVYWNAYVDACDKCSALDGQPERIWRRVAPHGPQLHDHCRCWLTYRRLFS